MSGLVCPALTSKPISIACQPMLIAASRCYLIQMLRSALTCINGCSCWSPDEENSPGFFLTMDALYRLSWGQVTGYAVRRRYCRTKANEETCTSSTHQPSAPLMIPDRCCIGPADGFLISSPCVHRPGSRDLARPGSRSGNDLRRRSIASTGWPAGHPTPRRRTTAAGDDQWADTSNGWSDVPKAVQQHQHRESTHRVPQHTYLHRIPCSRNLLASCS